MRSNTAVEADRRGHGHPGLRQPELLRDLLLSLLFAVATGLAGGLLLILLVFGCVEAGAAAEPLRDCRPGSAGMDGRPMAPDGCEAPRLIAVRSWDAPQPERLRYLVPASVEAGYFGLVRSTFCSGNRNPALVF